jgi:hypothetical protein
MINITFSFALYYASARRPEAEVSSKIYFILSFVLFDTYIYHFLNVADDLISSRQRREVDRLSSIFLDR